MEALLVYIIKVNIALAGFYLLYLLLFRKDTFIRLRRYYFLSAIIFSFSYPLFTVASLGNMIDLRSAPAGTETSVYIGELSVGEYIIDEVDQTTTPISWPAIAQSVLLTGIAFFAIRLLWQLFSIVRIKWRCEKRTLFGHSIYHLDDEITPFSFFNWIFIHTENHSDEELRQILLHEQTHVQQWHSLDVMLAEVVRILFWYNPIVWLMKRDIAINLEYLADNAVLQKGVETTEYQYHLLQLTYHDTAVQIVNNFNVPQLKQRIMMMNSKKSPLRKLAKYLSVLPLALLLITANSVYAQKNEPQPETTPPLEQEPVKKESKSDEERTHSYEYIKKMLTFIESEMKYPQIAKENGIQGRVLASFTIEKDGTVTNPKIQEGVDPALDKEAIRIINAMPKWTPFMKDGEPARSEYTLPFIFDLDGKDKSGEYSVIGFKTLDSEEKNEVVVKGSGLMTDATTQALADKFGKDKPLIIIDDVKMVKGFELNQIKPEEIESISILKDEAAVSEYGDEGYNGVILITTKKAALLKKAKDKILGPDASRSDEDIFVVVEDQPEFPGGMQAMMQFLGDNIKYPVEAQKNKIQGRVIVNFIVNKDGSLSDYKIVRGQDPLLDAEAIRVISTMPNWKPGKQKGEAVNVRFTLPIVFRLKADDDVDKKEETVTVTEEKNDASDKAFHEFIGKNVKYPVIAQENGITGVVRAVYDVNAAGEISNVRITEGADPALDAELIRITKLMPKDIALLRSGGKAASNVEISALFRLQGENTVSPPPVKSDVVVVGYGKPAEKK